MSLFQRIRTPFAEPAGDASYEPEPYAYRIGELLRERREELELDLDSIGAALRIKPQYLAALEQGRTLDLPGPTYAIGFIRAYAEYLGFDGEEVLDSYKAESTEVQQRPDLALPMPLGERSLPGGPILLVAAILALCGYGTWYYLSTDERSRPERVAAVPAELRQDAAAPAQAAQSTPATAAAAPQLASSTASGGSPAALGLGSEDAAPSRSRDTSPEPTIAAVAPPPSVAATTGSTATDTAAKSSGAIDIRALSDCWIQVRTADESIVFSRILKLGETYRVPRSGLLLRTGNAGALAITVDGKPAPSIGGIGTLRRNVSLEPEALLAGTAVHG